MEGGGGMRGRQWREEGGQWREEGETGGRRGGSGGRRGRLEGGGGGSGGRRETGGRRGAVEGGGETGGRRGAGSGRRRGGEGQCREEGETLERLLLRPSHGLSPSVGQANVAVGLLSVCVYRLVTDLTPRQRK